MTTKALLSYDQLNPNCLAKNIVDAWQQSDGILDSVDDKQVYFTLLLTNGNLSLRSNGQEIELTPCEAMKLAEIIQKLYNSSESDKNEK